MRFGITLLLLLVNVVVCGQLGGWGFRQPIQLNEQLGQGVSLFPVLLSLDTESLIQGGFLAPDGRDLRFADACGQEVFPHWVEASFNTDTTLVWVRVPSIPANDSLQIFLYCGQALATDVGSFASVFPNSMISGGSNLNLSGTTSVDWFELESGDTLFLSGGQSLEVDARMVRIAGTVIGNGAGHPSPPLGAAGQGLGGGATSANAGSGGGGHGGTGGLGGYDFGDSPGAGGMTIGTPYGLDWEMGASGGSAALRLGGAGGGALRLAGEVVEVSGDILCEGLEAQQPGAAQGGGGGAGGSILLQGVRLEVGGNLSVAGARGSRGFSSGNDDGGGGGGGRIKLFYDEEFVNSGTFVVDGGPAGVNGSVAPGEPGANGTEVDSAFAFAPVKAVVFPLVNNPLPTDLELVQTPFPGCEGDSLSFALPGGYSVYGFRLNSALVQSGADSVWGGVGLVDGDQVAVLAEWMGCIYRDTLLASLEPLPEMAIEASDSFSCLGDTVFLDAGGSWASVNWNFGGSGSVFPAVFSGIYIASGLDSNGCAASDTFIVNQSSPPITNIVAIGLPVCEGDTVSLTSSSVQAHYEWSNGDSGQSTLVNASGPYFLTVTNAFGCSSVFSTMLSLDTLPVPPLVLSGDSLLTSQNFFGYQWCLNGNLIGGAASFFYETTSNGIYAVKVQDGNGCWGASDTLMVGVGLEEAKTTGWQIGPNPFQEQFRLSFERAFVEGGKLEVVDEQGRVLWQKSASTVAKGETWEVWTADWSAGWYGLVWQSDGRKQSKTILKRLE